MLHTKRLQDFINLHCFFLIKNVYKDYKQTYFALLIYKKVVIILKVSNSET
uniref:Uncharacterized protein n=1 Tax=Lepeophtheirus salmonis TaxID=72036 RepID=A0A0K2T6Z4_LEPSM